MNEWMNPTNLFCWLFAWLNHFVYAIDIWYSIHGLQSRWNWEQTPVRKWEKERETQISSFASEVIRFEDLLLVGFFPQYLSKVVKIASCSHYYLSRWNHAFHQDNLIFVLLLVCVCFVPLPKVISIFINIFLSLPIA